MGMNVGDVTQNFNIYNYTTATTNLTILSASGNVGIGTASPNTLLNVGSGTPSTAANGIQFGSDTSANLYRISTGVIKTDGGLTVTGTTNCTAISVNGSVNVYGASSGYIVSRRDTSAAAWQWYSQTGELRLYDQINALDRLIVTTAGLFTFTSAISCSAITASGGTFTNDITVNGLTLGKGSGSNISNTAIGVATLQNNYSSASVGVSNTAIGSSALSSSTSGSYNTALGHLSEYFNTLGDYNTAVGYASLYTNTIGTRNVAVGASTLFSNVSGEYNTALGYQSIYGNISGLGNTGIGYRTLFSKSSGSYNTAIGYQASSNLTTGSNNIAIGYNAQLSNITSSNEIVIGDNNITLLRIPALGISATTSTFAATNISASSFTGSHFGTSSYASASISSSYALSASYAPGGSGLTGGTTNYIPLWTSATTQGISVISQSANLISVSGSLFVSQSITASSISASVLSASNAFVSNALVIGDNIITLNAAPSPLRYAGFEAYDSGSGTLTSLLWDSLNNYFFASGSEIGASRQFILGPSGEANLIANYIPLISGSNNLSSSVMYQSGGYIGVGLTNPVNKFDVLGNISCSVITASLFNGFNFLGGITTISSSTTTTVDLQYAVTQMQLSQSITTFAHSNAKTGTVTWMLATVGAGTSVTITWPTSYKWPGGVAPSLTTTTGKRDVYQFMSYDGASTSTGYVFATVVAQNM
jgi:hypothetical protein